MLSEWLTCFIITFVFYSISAFVTYQVLNASTDVPNRFSAPSAPYERAIPTPLLTKRARGISFSSGASTLVDDGSRLPAWMRAIALDVTDVIVPPSPTWKVTNGFTSRNGHLFITKARHELALRALRDAHLTNLQELSSARGRVEVLDGMVSSLQEKNVTLSASSCAAMEALEAFHTATLRKLAAFSKRVQQKDRDTIAALMGEKVATAVSHHKEIRGIREAFSASLKDLNATNELALDEQKAMVASLEEEKKLIVSSNEQEVQSLRETHEVALAGLATSNRLVQDKQQLTIVALKEENESATSSLKAELTNLKATHSGYVQDLASCKRDLETKESTIISLYKEIESLKSTNLATSELAVSHESTQEEREATIVSLREEVVVISKLAASNELLHKEKDSTIISMRNEVDSLKSTNRVLSKLAAASERHRKEKESATVSLRMGISSLKSANQAISELVSSHESIQKEQEEKLSALQHENETLRASHAAELERLSAEGQRASEYQESTIASLEAELELSQETSAAELEELEATNKQKEEDAKETIESLKAALAEKDASLKQLSREMLVEKDSSPKQQSQESDAIIKSLQAEIEEKDRSAQQLMQTSSQIALQKELLINELRDEVRGLQQQLDSNDLAEQLAIAQSDAKQNAAGFYRARALAGGYEKLNEELKDQLELANQNHDDAMLHADDCEKQQQYVQRKLNKLAMDDLAMRGVEWTNRKQATHIRTLLAERIPLENKAIRLHNENLRLKADVQDLSTSAKLARDYADDVSEKTLTLLKDLKAKGLTNVAHLAEATNDEIVGELATWMNGFVDSANHNLIAGRDVVAENNRLTTAAHSDRELINTLNETIATQTDSLNDLEKDLTDAQFETESAHATVDATSKQLTKLKPLADRVPALEACILALKDDLDSARIETAPEDLAVTLRDLQGQVESARAAQEVAEERAQGMADNEELLKGIEEELAIKDKAMERRWEVMAAVAKKNHRLVEEVKKVREEAGLEPEEEIEDLTPVYMRAMFEQMASKNGYDVDEEEFIEEEIAWAEKVGDMVVNMEQEDLSPTEVAPSAAEKFAGGVMDRILAIGRDVFDEGKGEEDIRYRGPDDLLDLTTDADVQREADQEEEDIAAGVREWQEELRAGELTLEEHDERILEEEAF